MSAEAIITLVIAVVGTGISIWQWRVSAASGFAEALDKSQDSISKLQKRVEDLEDQLDGAWKRIDALRDENRWLRDGINQLVGQLKEKGAEPVWTPTSEKGKH